MLVKLGPTTDIPQLPPAELSGTLIDELQASSTTELRTVDSYVDALLDHRPTESDGDSDSTHSEISDSNEKDNEIAENPSTTDGRPDDVPARATVTIKEINDNRYYYWEWGDGDQIRSKYKSPAS